MHILDRTIHDGYGQDILLEQNADWKESDIDYTPYRNILSAVWPNLRHRNYTWAVRRFDNTEISMHYRDNNITLDDPCTSPKDIKCGNTGKRGCLIFCVVNRISSFKCYVLNICLLSLTV